MKGRVVEISKAMLHLSPYHLYKRINLVILLSSIEFVNEASTYQEQLVSFIEYPHWKKNKVGNIP